LLWLNSFSNENCGMARAPFSEDCPLEIENSVNFTERDGSTIVSLRARPFGESAAERQYFEDLHPSMTQGYGGTFDQLVRASGLSAGQDPPSTSSGQAKLRPAGEGANQSFTREAKVLRNFSTLGPTTNAQ
jgi:hypothetical protein